MVNIIGGAIGVLLLTVTASLIEIILQVLSPLGVDAPWFRHLNRHFVLKWGAILIVAGVVAIVAANTYFPTMKSHVGTYYAYSTIGDTIVINPVGNYLAIISVSLLLIGGIPFSIAAVGWLMDNWLPYNPDK